MQSSKYLTGNDSGLKKSGSGKVSGFLLDGTNADLNDITLYDGYGTSATKAEVNIFNGTLDVSNASGPAVCAVDVDDVNYTNVEDGDSVTIDGVTYTWRDTMTQAYDVQIGADFIESFVNMSNATIGNAGDYFAGTLPTDRIVFFAGGKPLFISRGIGNQFNDLVISIYSGNMSLTPEGQYSSSTLRSKPLGGVTLTVGHKEYEIMSILPEQLNGILGTNLPVDPNKYSFFSGGDGFIGMINGDQSMEGQAYSTGTTENDDIEAVNPNTGNGMFILRSKVAGYAGNYLPVRSNVGIIISSSTDDSDTSAYVDHLVGGTDSAHQVSEMLGIAGAKSYKFPTPLEFNNGLYIEYTGNSDYTIIYDGFNT
jgi:hypothetical protein